jgi:dienelactone hydrolase
MTTQRETASAHVAEHLVHIPIGTITLEGNLNMPAEPQGIVLFAHGSGSSRHSPRNRFVAHNLNQRGIATLLIDLLTADEETIDRQTRHLRFDINLLAERLGGATDWLNQNQSTSPLNIGYFGASTGAAAALVAAAAYINAVHAIVSRGGRPDMAGAALQRVAAPTLLIVGERDEPVIALNRQALDELHKPPKEIAIVAGATHLFEEPGKLEEVAQLAGEWFSLYL